MTGKHRRIVIFVVLLLATLGIDQTSKAWARTLPVRPSECSMTELAAQRCAGVPQPVIEGAWDWELAMNPGAAFSFFTGSGGRVILSIIAAAALIGIGIVASRTPAERTLRLAALALIAGGALGNLLDRVRDGAVTDFVRWRIHDPRWPVFNVADVALVAAVGLLVIEGGLSRRRAVAT